MPVVFLSYRRADTSGYAGRLATALEQHFGYGSVFHDIEAIAPGRDYAKVIDEAVARAGVLLVLIGDTWLSESGEEGTRRLDDPHDFVRLEVSSALRRGTPVLPVLLEGAAMPGASALPPALEPLARLQAIELSDTRWDYDVGRLLRAVEALTETAPRRPRRRMLAVTASMGVALAAGAALWWLAVHPTDVSGRWEFPDGGYWLIVQDGDRLAIEEVHGESRQVWLRGTGRMDGNRIEVDLDAVYDRGGARGHVVIEAGGQVLRGQVRMLPRGYSRALLLTKAGRT